MQIYGLFESDTLELRYIGQTQKPLLERLAGHLSPSQLESQNRKNNWIKSVKMRGSSVVIHPIQTLETKGDLNLAEIYWIRFFLDQGCRLTNQTDGGEGGSPMRGRTHTPETKAKMSATAKASGRKMPSMKGRHHSEETKAKLANAATGKPSAMKGRCQTPETRVKMSLAKTGKPSPKKACSDQEIAALYLAGLSSKKIAAKMKTCSKRVLAVLKGLGIQLRRNRNKGRTSEPTQ